MAVSRTQLLDVGQSIDSSRSPYAYVQEFFGYKPPELTPAAFGGSTKSTSTNAPGPFDKHLSKNLRLRRVFKLSSIPSDLAQVAQNALDNYPAGSLPPINANFPTLKRCDVATAHSGHEKILSEKGVEGFYFRTTAEHCSTVAGTLIFQLPEWSSGPLVWTLEPISAPRNNPRNKALADGFLNLVDPEFSVPKSLKQVIDTFPVLSTSEFKNLNFDIKRPTFHDMTNSFLDDWFPWEGCELGEACSTTHVHTGVIRCPMGYDAEENPCPTFNVARCANASHSYGPQPDTESDFKAWVKEQDYPSGARCILQQAWTQAVLHDATFFLINAGTIELICIRDRKNQALYLSDVIDVANCDNYGQIHTGLYIAAFLDAKDRTSQLLKSKPGTWDVKSGIDTDKILDLTACDETTVSDTLWDQAFTRPWLKILPARAKIAHHPYAKHKLYQRVYLDERTLPFADTDTFIQVTANDTVHGSLTVCSGMLEIPGAVTKTHAKVAVVIKSALNRTEEVSRLTEEYQVYLALDDAGVSGIPKVIGFFGYSGDDSCKTYTALLLENMGKSLEELKEASKKPKVSREQLHRFEQILKMVHSAGYRQGRLTERSLMFNTEQFKKKPKYGFLRLSDSEVSIVGFADAARLPSDPVQREELVRAELSTLQSLWTNPLKRKMPALGSTSHPREREQHQMQITCGQNAKEITIS